MKKGLLILFLFPIISACTSNIAPMATGKDGEYVVIGRNMAGPFSSLELAQQEAVTQATEFCNKMGAPYKKLYAIDRPLAAGQVPESTLYFTCLYPAKENSNTASSSPKSEVVASSNEFSALISVLEKKGILTKSEVVEELNKLKAK